MCSVLLNNVWFVVGFILFLIVLTVAVGVAPLLLRCVDVAFDVVLWRPLVRCSLR